MYEVRSSKEYIKLFIYFVAIIAMVGVLVLLYGAVLPAVLIFMAAVGMLLVCLLVYKQKEPVIATFNDKGVTIPRVGFIPWREVRSIEIKEEGSGRYYHTQAYIYYGKDGVYSFNINNRARKFAKGVNSEASYPIVDISVLDNRRKITIIALISTIIIFTILYFITL